MALRFSSSGAAVYGTGTLAVNGATPAALAGRTVGPAAWKQSGVLVYQDGGVAGAGPWTFKQLTLPATIANLDSEAASVVAGGGGEWAAYNAGTGVRTSIAIGPFAGATLLDVSPDGELVIAVSNGVVGLRVYDDAGAVIYEDLTVVLQSTQVCLRDSHLSYYDATGWHLIDLNTGTNADWFPRTDGVNCLVPVSRGGTLYVLERTNVLTLRPANQNKGWQIAATYGFSPDAALSGSVVRCGYCTDPQESVTSLVVIDVTVSNAANVSMRTGTVVAGAIVYGGPVTVTPSTFTVGAKAGNSLVAPVADLPVRHQLIHKENGLMTEPWIKALRQGALNTSNASGVLQKLPTPNLTSQGYDKVASSGQPTMQAQAGMTTFNLESADGSVGIVLNPATNTADLTVQGGSWIPLVDGSEPPNFITDGAGHLILVAYP